MADVVDKANDLVEIVSNYQISKIKNRAAGIPIGVSGICKECGEHSTRLVDGKCAPCRDGRNG